MKKFPKSQRLFERAQNSIPGGVNSPVRAFKSVGGTPLFIRKATGARVTDVDGNTYVDLVGSWGPMILGHASEKVLQKVLSVAQNGMSFGAPTENEILLAEKICDMVPSIEQVRLVNSGTEATMSALRLARGVTQRDLIIKFAGCYHGHADHLLVAAGSGALTFGTPDSAGVPPNITRDTLVLPYNDLEIVEECVKKYHNNIAAIIVEPVAGNMGCVLPKAGFLEGLRNLCTQNKSLLVFDEVMTGFRLARGGAQERFSIQPDITCLGKIIGGGLPVGAYGASKELMSHISPNGPVYQAGTLSGNPLAVAAGLATLELLDEARVYETLETKCQRFAKNFRAALESIDLPLCLNQIGSMFCLYFHEGPVEDFAAATASDGDRFKRYFHAMLAEGIYLAPSPFESGFVSLAHSDEDLDWVISAAIKTIQSI